MSSPINEMYIAVVKAAVKQQISVRKWCINNGISYSSFHNLVHHSPSKQGKLITYINVVKALKGGVRDVE